MSNRIGYVMVAITSLSPSLVFAAVSVPEMDAGAVPLVIGLTLALVMLVKDRVNK